MPRVRILAGLAGSNERPGEVRDMTGPEAQQLVAEGRGELVREERETPEGTARIETTKRTRVRERR